MYCNILFVRALVHFSLALSLTTATLLSAPYFGETFTYKQPDGQSFTARLHGDEFFAYQETEDGYLIVRDTQNGFFCYAKISPNGTDIISTGVRVGQTKPAGLGRNERMKPGMAMKKSIGNRNLLGVDDKGRRNHGKKLSAGKGTEILNEPATESTPQSAPDEGPSSSSTSPPLSAPPVTTTLNDRVGLVLLASFPDRPSDVTKTVADIDNYCNAETYTANGNATSIYGYFKIQSNGKLNYKNNVTAWFTAANPRSYYTDNTVGYGTRARDLIKEGLAAIKAQGFDFTQCDGDNNGKLDGVNIFYAGDRVNAWSEGIWPHQSSSSWTGLSGTGLSSTSYDYQITDMPASLPIGTFCHENGHMICDFPDLYSYDGNAANMGAYSLMASSGSTHPRHVDPYLKIRAGWADVVDIASTSHQLCGVQQDRNFFYRYNNPAKSQEYFVFEVRGTAGYEGVWNGAVATNPANGLVVYHVLETGSNPNSTIFTASNPACNYTKPYEIMVVESTPSAAVSPWYDDPTPGSNDAFTSSGVSSISDVTTPADLKFWTSTGRTLASGANVHSISAAGANMTFIVGAGNLPATPATSVTATQLKPQVDYGGNAASDIFSVFNNSGGTLTYTVSDNAAWLSCTPASGTATTESDAIAVSYTTSALAAGTHSATITIDGGAAGIKTIPVTLTVNAQPTISISHSSITLAGISGIQGPTSSFSVGNTGGGTAAYTITKTQSWLSLDRTSGSVATEQDLITISLNATSLAPGIYNDTITITSAAATNSPVTIPVTFDVGGTDMIVTSPNGGESWYTNNTHAITWASSLGGNVKIELLKNGSLNLTIAVSTTNDGSYSWSIPGGQTLASDYKIRITSVESPTKTDLSFSNFSIAQDLIALAVDSTGLSWTATGNLPWFSQTSTTNDTLDAAQSGAITHSQSSSIETTLTGAGTLTFFWKVSSESGYDFLRFYLNGVQVGAATQISGNVNWILKTITIPAGSNVVKWTYSKDGSAVEGSDAAWLDQVVFSPTNPTYTVTYDGNGHAGGIAPSDQTKSQGVNLTLATNTGNLVRTGYAFVGWNTNTSGTGTDYAVGAAYSADAAITLYAKWTAVPTYTITYNGNSNTGGSVPSNQTKTQGVNLTLDSNSGNLVRTGYAFAGWNTNSGGTGTNHAAGAAYSTDADLALYAKWTSVGILSVTPAGDLTSVGSYNGPFSPSSLQYTLTNTGTSSLNWTAAKTAAWLTLSSTSGTLAAGANTTVTVSINSGANTLAVNNYSDTVTFTNTTNAIGNTTRAASLTISKANQTISFGSLSNVLDNAAPFNLTASSSSSLTVSYVSSNTSVATVSGDTVTVAGLGTTTITASQAGNTNHNAATNVQQTLTVVRANPLAVNGGPYVVYVNGTLSLNGSGSFPSSGQTISSYAWDLNNDSNFSDASGASPASINFATLISTWGMSIGSNAIQLRVTDSAAKTSTVSTTVTIVSSFTWDSNNTGAGQTNGAGAWLGANQWWDGSANTNWVSGASAIFGGSSTAGGAVTLASATTADSLLFNTFTGTYTFGSSGQAITLNNGISKNIGSGTAQIISPLILGGAQTWTNNSGALELHGTLNLNDKALTFTGAGTTTFSVASTGVISGAGGLTMSGSGLLNLGAGQVPAHTYSGDTNLNGGVTMFANNYSANSNININGGILESYWNTNITQTLGSGANQIRITGGKSGFSLNGNTTLTVTLGGGAITWGTANFDPTKFVLQSANAQQSSAITFANALNFGGASRTILVNEGTTGAARATISGAISNGTGFVKEGSGLLMLTSDPSTWSGNTTVSAGRLHMGGINLANIGGGTGRKITVAAGAGIGFNVLSNAVLNRIVETSNEIGVMTNTTADNLDFSSSAGATLSNAFLGNYSTNGAKTTYSGIITPGSNGYKLGAKGSSGNLGISGANRLTGANTLTVGQTGSSGVRVTLAGANNFTGKTVINSGAKLTLGDNFAIQNSVLDLGAAGGNIAFNGGTDSATITGNTIASSPTFGGLLGSRSLFSAYTNVGGNNESNLANTAMLGFTLNTGIGVNVTYFGAIGGFGTGASSGLGGNSTLTKIGLGTQTLSGANTYTGITTVSAGKLFIDGSLSNTAVALNVGSGATLGGTGTIGRDVTIAAGGKLEFNISTSNGSHNSLDISTGRNVTFSGNSELTITTSGGATTGTYTLITGGNNIIGSAPASLVLPSGWVATASISGNNLQLIVTSTTGPGPVDHFAISSIASPQTVGAAITGITITAQDASNATATSFTGTVTFGGTAGITGTSASFTAGVLTGVSITPVNVGTNLTFTVTDGASHNGSAAFTVLSRFNSWTSETFTNNFTDTAVTSNPDGDGFTNLQEFAFGMDPTTSINGSMSFVLDGNMTSAGIPVLMKFASDPDPTKFHAVFPRRKDYSAAGINYVAMFSADLSAWTASSAGLDVRTGDGSSGNMEAVSIPFPATVPLSGGGSAVPKFFKIGVQQN